MKFCGIVDDMESGVIPGISLKLGDPDVGEEFGAGILGAERPALRW
jgi:hypothetical protein